MTALRLSSDELRAAAAVVRRDPWAAFVDGWAPAERTVADAVALRGLLARGLVEVSAGDDVPEVALATEFRRALWPLLAAESIVELQVDAGPIGGRRQVLAAAGADAVHAVEVQPWQWGVGPLATAIGPVAATEVDELLRDARPGQGEEHLIDDPSLIQAEASPLPLLGAARRLVTVRSARRRAAGVLDGAALTWLDSGKCGVWTVERLDGDEEPARYRLTATDPERLRAEVADLLAAVVLVGTQP